MSDPELLRQQALAHANQGQLLAALALFQQLDQITPNQASTQHNIGVALNRLERYAQALPWFKRALAIAPQFTPAWIGLAAALEELGQRAEAGEALAQVIQADPSAAQPRLLQVMHRLPAVAQTLEDSEQAPVAFAEALSKLTDWAEQNPQALQVLGEHVGDRQPFALAYRPGNHCQALSLHGDLMARAAQSYWQVPAPAPPPRPRIRLAILSAQIRRHSVWDVIVKGIVHHLSRRHFELLIYHTGTETDAETQWAEGQAEQFISGPRSPEDWLRQIRADAPDVLFCPEIGMDPLAGKLAALRLAPLQVTSWGHPITTGLPEMDLFFSGDLLEPPDAQEHYRERLIRLPGTGVCTEWPTVNMAPLPVGYLRPRQPGRVRLLLCQHPCKFEPADMPLIAEVLRACAPCELYVLKSRRLPILGDQAATLLRQAVEAAGLDPQNVLLERAWVDREVFLSLLDAVDLYLDLPAFSGYTTAWQALHLGLPVVTLEGPMLRQRLAAGLLRQMGVTETIAQNSADYVSIAARLATECRDSEAWAARRATVQAAALNADHQVEAVRAFEQQLIDSLKQLQASQTAALDELRACHCQYPGLSTVTAAKQYLASWPDCPVGWLILARSCETARDWSGAVAAARRLCVLQPEISWHWSYLGLLLKRQGLLGEAERALSQALELAPEDVETLNLLGIVQMLQGRPAAAEPCLRQALIVKPELTEAWNNLGTALRDLDRLDESQLAFRQALSLEPGNPRARSNLLMTQAYTAALTPLVYRQQAANWELEVLTVVEREDAQARHFKRANPSNRPLYLGILSAELGAHPVGNFLLSWLTALDRRRFRVFIYPTSERFEPEVKRFRALADVWRPVVDLNDAQAVELICADGIDILMETSGHTQDNRLGIIARRAAPVQCHYIGYFATTGLTEMDYFIADSVLIPPEHDVYFTEQICRLPRSRYAYQPLERAPQPNWQPDPHGVVRLGSFNHLTKVREESLALWAQVLRALPQAHLMLKARQASDSGVQARILKQLHRHGIKAERIEFVSALPSWREHMAAYNQIDIALDTLPFNSATTGCEALWMGVPLISRIGDCFAGRQAASLLTGLGRKDWIAATDQDFVHIVTKLAEDSTALAACHASLRVEMQRGELCDGSGLARILEAEFIRMVTRSFALQDRT